MDNNQTLIASIEAFDIDGGPVQTSFADRLAEEQGWTPEFTQRVILEYKRFVALAMISKTPVTPSLIVDEAWHLHLVYTRSYWERFMPLLPRPLHHDPTKGGESEDTKHQIQFGSTLELYRQTFGNEAPADIWRAQTATKVALEKQPTLSKLRLGALLVATAVLLVGCTSIAQVSASMIPILIVIGVGGMLLIFAAVLSNQQRQRNGQCSSSGGGCSGGGGDSGGHAHGGLCSGGGHCSGGHGGGDGGSGGGDGGGGCGGGGCGGGGD